MRRAMSRPWPPDRTGKRAAEHTDSRGRATQVPLRRRVCSRSVAHFPAQRRQRREGLELALVDGAAPRRRRVARGWRPACADRPAAPAPAPRSPPARGRSARRAARSRRPRRGRRRSRPPRGAVSGSQVRRDRLVDAGGDRVERDDAGLHHRGAELGRRAASRRPAAARAARRSAACAPPARRAAAPAPPPRPASGAMSKSKSSRSRSWRSSITRANSGLSGAWGMSSGIVVPRGRAAAAPPAQVP